MVPGVAELGGWLVLRMTLIAHIAHVLHFLILNRYYTLMLLLRVLNLLRKYWYTLRLP